MIARGRNILSEQALTEGGQGHSNLVAKRKKKGVVCVCVRVRVCDCGLPLGFIDVGKNNPHKGHTHAYTRVRTTSENKAVGWRMLQCCRWSRDLGLRWTKKIGRVFTVAGRGGGAGPFGCRSRPKKNARARGCWRNAAASDERYTQRGGEAA